MGTLYNIKATSDASSHKLSSKSMRRNLFIIAFTVFCVFTVEAGLPNVSIFELTNNQKVSHMHFLEGDVTDKSSEVWVVIHPVGSSGYWVQEPVRRMSNGDWTARVFFGRQNLDSGVKFEVRVFANPQKPFSQTKMNKWPIAEAKSDAIVVIRE